MRFAVWLFFCSSMVPIGARAQSAVRLADPAHPFAGITSAEQWKAKFISGKPKVVRDDPFGNMTTREFWQHSWKGQNIDHPFRPPDAIKGSGGEGVVIRSPYPYESAEAQYDAWRKAANGGTTPPRRARPDWSGDWHGVSAGVLIGSAKISDVLAAVSDAYKPRYLELLRGEWEGGHQWWPGEFCLPDGFGRLWWVDGTTHFMMDQHMVLINKDRPDNPTRYVYTDGRGFLPKDQQVPDWYGDSEGFWDGDELVIYTKNIRRWAITHGLPEFSDKLEAVERLKRFGGELLDDVTLYDPEAFAFPWHDLVIYEKYKDWTVAPATYQDCVSTNNIYMDSKGVLQERVPGDAGYTDLSDDRPWATAYKLWDSAHPKAAARWRAIFRRALNGSSGRVAPASTSDGGTRQ